MSSCYCSLLFTVLCFQALRYYLNVFSIPKSPKSYSIWLQILVCVWAISLVALWIIFEKMAMANSVVMRSSYCLMVTWLMQCSDPLINIFHDPFSYVMWDFEPHRYIILCSEFCTLEWCCENWAQEIIKYYKDVRDIKSNP